MKTILATFLTVLLLLPISAIGEIQTITHTVKQAFGGSQSPDDARISAVAKAKREALEMAGTYIESLTVVKNSQVDKDEILALAAGVLKAEVVSQENYHTKDAFGIDVVVKVLVDTSVLEGRVKKLLQDRTHLEQLNQARKKEKELLDKVASLEEENRRLTAINQSTQKLRKEFQLSSRGLTAMDWVYKAGSLWAEEKYTDPKKAIEYLNEAIRLQPDLAIAFSGRGAAYADLKQYQRAIEDYSEAIHLKPEYATAYGYRGLAYDELGQYQQAIKDYDEVIRLKPDESAHVIRGAAYAALKQYQCAIEDYSEAIRLKPDHALAYSIRGKAYYNLGQYQRAIKDCDKSIGLNPKDAEVYYLRGDSYGGLGNKKRAIKDYDKAIELNPKYADAYFNRGNAYADLGNYKRAIKDYNESVKLNPKDTVSYYNRGNAYGRLGNRKQAIEDKKIAARLGLQEAQDFLRKRGIDWSPEGVPSVTSSDKPPQKPEKNAESSSSVTSPDKTQQKPVKNVELSTDADDPYKGIKAIVLKNGNVIEGKILSMDPDIVKIRTKDGKVSSYSFKNEVQTFITQ